MNDAITSPDTAALESAATLARAIQTSAEWRELESARLAAQTDPRFAQMVQRHSELARLQNNARGTGGGLEGKALVESLALRDQIQRHEIYRRQQLAWDSVIEMFQSVNAKISEELGIDFASNAAPRGRCCG